MSGVQDHAYLVTPGVLKEILNFAELFYFRLGFFDNLFQFTFGNIYSELYLTQFQTVYVIIKEQFQFGVVQFF